MSKRKQNRPMDILPLLSKVNKKNKNIQSYQQNINIQSSNKYQKKYFQLSNNFKKIKNIHHENQRFVKEKEEVINENQTEHLTSSEDDNQDSIDYEIVKWKQNESKKSQSKIKPQKQEQNINKYLFRRIDSVDEIKKRQFSLKQIQKQNNELTEQQAIQRAIKQSLKQAKESQRKQIQSVSLSNYKFSNTFNDKQHKDTHDSKKWKKQIQKQVSEPKKRSRSKRKQKQQKHGPFVGLHIALTGQFEPYSKNKLIQLLQRLGAQLPKSITKKTTHLLQGCYVVNQFQKKTDQDIKTTTKSIQAVEKGIIIIPFQDLNIFFKSITGKTLGQLIEEDHNNQLRNYNTNLGGLMKTGSMNWSGQKQSMNVEEKMNIPWTEKYKPRNCDQIIGQSSQVRDLLQWLRIWQDIHILGNKRDIKSTYNSFMPSGTINSNAALLSGDAGLGKTTTVRLVAAQLGYSLVQFNASDVRNKKSIEQISRDNLSFCYGYQCKQMKKSLILMDEVDGMSSGDRGGISAIIEMIKKTKIPIICICNDRQSTKIRSLASYCYDIKYHKPNKNAIIKKLQQIINNQGGISSNKSLQVFIQFLQNDIRQIFNYLQFMFKGGIKNIDIDLIQKKGKQTKDTFIMLNFFQVAKRLMNRTMFSGMSISQRIDLSFIDSDMVPLMIQQNYLNACIKKKMMIKQFHQIVKASKGIVMADLIDRTIMKNQNYCLMPNKMFLSCVYPCQMVCQNLGFPKFTQWFGKYSSQKKNRRLIKQLKSSLSCVTNVTSYSVKHHFVPILFQKIYQALKISNPFYQQLVKFMIHYGITPFMITQHLSSLLHGDKQNLFKSIETAKKTKLTKIYNKIHEQIKLKKTKNNVKIHIQHLKYDPVLGQIQGSDQENSQQQPQKQKQQDENQHKNKNKKIGKSKKQKKKH